MKKLTLIVPGSPVGKARPRVTKYGTYTPEKTKNQEQLIQYAYIAKCRNQSYFDANKALAMTITAYMPIPKNTSKANRELMNEGKIRPTKKPDCDNIGKLAADALNGYAYPDDKQIVSMTVSKYYSANPRTEIEILEVPLDYLLTKDFATQAKIRRLERELSELRKTEVELNEQIVNLREGTE